MLYSKKSNFNHVARYLIKLSLFASVEVFSDQVSQSSASDYHYSRPNLQSNIQGRVIGEVPEYDILRSEDIAWLREAYAERWALAGNFSGLSTNVSSAPIFGEWDMSLKDDKRYTGWVSATKPNGSGGLSTNIVVLYKPVTNIGEGVDSAWQKENTIWEKSLATIYLSEDDTAYVSDAKSWRIDHYGSSSSPYVDEDWGHTVITNIYEENVTFPAISNMISTISMPMTNGTTCVFTNTWKEFYTTNATFTRTNHIDRGHDLINMIFTNRVVSHYGRKIPSGKLHGLIDVSFFTNHYAYLKGLTRIEKDVSVKDGDELKSFGHSFGSYSYWASGASDTWDNTYTASPIDSNMGEIVIERSVSEGKTYYEAETTAGAPPSWKIGFDNSVNTTIDTADGIVTYLVDDMGAFLVPDGNVNCIKKAKLYARVSAEYSKGSYYGYEDDEDGEPDTETGEIGPFYPDDLDYQKNYTSFTWRCVVPAGDVQLGSEGGTNVTFSMSMSAIMNKAWSATGAPSLPSGPISLENACPDPLKKEVEGEGWATASGVSGTGDRYKVFVNDLLLIIDLEPRTMLESWKTEE